MVVEYLLLLMISTMIIAGSFGLGTGPIEMFKRKTPVLAFQIQENLETGAPFRTERWQ